MSGSIRRTLTALALAALAGCQGTARPIPNDPLVGGGPAIGAPVAGVARRDDAAAARARTDAPPVPPANTTSSPAALTVGAITQPAAADRRPAGQGVTLGGPRPRGVATPAAPPDETRSHAAPSPGGGDSYEALQQRLQARGIVWQQLKMVERDRWDYYCAIPNPKEPSLRRMFEARGRASAVAAMREVLAEIESDRR